MALTEDQIKKLREHLSNQIKDLPSDKKKTAQEQIDSMSPEALETMLKQQESENPFRMLASKQIPSTVIEENQDALAILEINPISKGHTMIVPIKPIKGNKIPNKIKSFSDKITQKLKDSLSPKDVKVFSQEKFGELIIDLVPEYDKPISQNSERKKSTPEKLKNLADKINTPVIKKEKKPEKLKIKKEKKESVKLKRRIP